MKVEIKNELDRRCFVEDKVVEPNSKKELDIPRDTADKLKELSGIEVID